jgi:hypothetical protein
MQCPQCSGTKFEKISISEFKCQYCQTVIYPHEVTWFRGTPQKNQEPINTKKVIFGGVVFLTLIIFGLVLFLGYKSPSSQSVKPHLPPISVTAKSEPIENSSETNLALKPEENTNSVPQSVEFNTVEVAEQPKAEFTQISEVPDSIGNVYFIGIYKNTGTVVIGKPKVVITLYAGEKKVFQSHGYAQVDFLFPKEEVPVVVLCSKPPKYSKYVHSHTPEAPYSSRDVFKAKLTFMNAKIQPGKYKGSYTLSGEIKNDDSVGFKHVNIAGVILNKDKKFISHGSAYVSQDVLSPSDYAPFKFDFYTKEVPASFILNFSASRER